MPAPVAGDVLQQALSAGKPTVAEFGANACAACREMKPILEALRRDHGGRKSVVDVDLIAQKHMGYLQRYCSVSFLMERKRFTRFQCSTAGRSGVWA
jgi:hypothetical protein